MRKVGGFRKILAAIALSNLLIGCAPEPVKMSWLNKLPQGICPENHWRSKLHLEITTFGMH